ncbi:hypothetical protein GCM10010156_53470 [Planobispora rosea]|uniref:Uncharacterized protein n=1 Tax=Planobispora rosea TaxID=35762 RepID=A0A8J3S9L8_PLARO|nr:hypothetical protein [Planobispora rosea]GGS88301.1 hypothetical protein GCM10010156_53470 [Planobispora rosea]GIH88617.1 hypothetical protein Pro02_70250 [Planobispora rosea]
MTFAYGLPSDSRPYPARHGYAARHSRPGNALGLGSLATAGAAVLAGFLPLTSWASVTLTLASVALGFAALGRAHRTETRRNGAHQAGESPNGESPNGDHGAGAPRRRAGWPGLLLELTVGALVLWASAALFTALTDADLRDRTGGAEVRELRETRGAVTECLRSGTGQLTCEAGVLRVPQ